MESIISDFHIDWRLLIAQIINFSVVFTVLYYFAFKPIFKMMGERTGKIEQGLKDADDSRLKLNAVEKETQVIMKDARKNADAIVAEADHKAEVSQTEAVEKAKVKVKAVIDQEKIKLEKEKEQTMVEIQQEAGALAVSLAEKILAEKMNPAADDNFINKIIK